MKSVSDVMPPGPDGPQRPRLLGGQPDDASAPDDGPDRPDGPTGPDVFRRAVQSLVETPVRREVRTEALRAPQRLAPYSYAMSADVLGSDEALDGATGRLVLLHDPDGHEAWNGVLRLVAYVSTTIDAEIGVDTLLPTVGWSWLTSALDERGAAYCAAGGTVTQKTSTRFGDIHGPHTTVEFELRASWTATDADLSAHLEAYLDLLCTAAGLPPEGVTVLSAT